jgi:hypothetical protein
MQAVGLLLAVCVAVRPVVLAPFRRCARPGPSTPDAAQSRRARRRVLRLHLAERYCLLGILCGGSGLSLVGVMREGARAAPAPA